MATKKTNKKGAKTPTTGKKKSTQVAKCGTKQAAKTGQKSSGAIKPAGRNIFAGATEISMTGGKIAVTRSVSENVNGKYSERTTREYHDPTPENMAALKEVMGSHDVKKITVKLSENANPKKPSGASKKATKKK